MAGTSGGKPADEASADERLSTLFKLHGDAIYGYVAQRAGIEAAGDLVSEVFLVAWRRLDSVRAGQERPWLFGIARRLLLPHHRQSRHWALLQDRVEANSDVVEVDLADRAVSRGEVLAALAALPESHRDALLLVYWYELSPSEAAQASGLTRAAFTVRLHRARRRLAQILNEATYTSMDIARDVPVARRSVG